MLKLQSHLVLLYHIGFQCGSLLSLLSIVCSVLAEMNTLLLLTCPSQNEVFDLRVKEPHVSPVACH